MSYDKKQSIAMLNYLSTDNYEEATKCLLNGADPNFYRIEKDEYGNFIFSSFIREFFQSLWMGGKTDRFMDNYYNMTTSKLDTRLARAGLEDKEQQQKYIAKCQDEYNEMKIFLEIWHKKGGDFLTPVNEPLMPNMQFYIDDAFQYTFPSLQNKIKKDQLYTTELYEAPFEALIAVHSILHFPFLPESYKGSSIAGIFTQEAWNTSLFEKIKPLLIDQGNMTKADNEGNTPLHYSINPETENLFHGLEPLTCYMNKYDQFIKQYFSKDDFFIKNNEGLIPLEKMLKDNAYGRVIPLYKLTLEHNPSFEISPEIVNHFFKNASQLQQSDDDHLVTFYQETLLPFIIELEKTIIQKIIKPDTLVKSNKKNKRI